MPGYPQERKETVIKTAITVSINILNSDQLQTSIAKEIVGKILLEVWNHGHTLTAARYNVVWPLSLLQVGKLEATSVVVLAEQLIEGIKTGAVSNGQ